MKSFSGFNTNSVASADLSGLEGLVNAAAAHDPASYYHHHQHHHHASHHQTAHGIQSHQMHHNAYQQHFHSAHHVQPPQITDRRSYFEESSSLLGLGSLAASSTSASASASTGTTTNNESYSPNSTTNNLPSSTVKIKSGNEKFVALCSRSLVLCPFLFGSKVSQNVLTPLIKRHQYFLFPTKHYSNPREIRANYGIFSESLPTCKITPFKKIV